jgi:hypothetical protein
LISFFYIYFSPLTIDANGTDGIELKIFLLFSGIYDIMLDIINPHDSNHKFSNAWVNHTAKEPKREHQGLPTTINEYIQVSGELKDIPQVVPYTVFTIAVTAVNINIPAK